MENNLYLTEKQIERNRRNAEIIKEFDKMKGSTSVIIDDISKRFPVTGSMIWKILTKAGKIGIKEGHRIRKSGRGK